MSRALIEKLVDAMNKHGSPYLGHIEEYQSALVAAREYLAQPNTQEPVGYAYAHQDFIGSVIGAKGEWTPDEIALYTHPAPQAKPLTQAQRREIWDSVKYKAAEGWRVDFGDVCDAVEAAHGLKP